MDKKWHRLEVVVDKLIPWMIILLLIIIVLDLFYADMVELYHLHPYIVAGDWVVVAVFCGDLFFKWRRVRHLPTFLKKYWLDILAVFPFIILFRLSEGIFQSLRLSEELKKGQSLLHEGLEIEKEGSKIAREAEKLFKYEKEGSKVVREAEEVYKISRTRYILRFIRPFARLPRFLKYIPRLKKYIHFYEKPSGRHYSHEKKRS